MARKADYLRRSVYRAAAISSIATAIITIGLAFVVSYALGNPERDALVAKNARDIAQLVNQARDTNCANFRSTIQLLVDQPGTPSQAVVQDCSALPKVKYKVYREEK